MLLCPDKHPGHCHSQGVLCPLSANPGKEDLGFASGELQPVMKESEKKVLRPSKRSFRIFMTKYVCIHTNKHTYTHIYR